MSLRVVGLGDPVMDLLATVSHEFLDTITKEPGGCFTVQPEEMVSLLASVTQQSELRRVPGGSSANVIKGLANLAPHRLTATFLGMVGRDATGREYRQRLEEQGVVPVLLETASDLPSACSLCLVTPDGQRTMRTCLGASLELKSASQVSSDWSIGLSLLHCEGYCLYRPQLAKEMMGMARASGALVSMDLASFELVRNCKASLIDLLESKCLDVVFANEHEVAELALVLQLVPPAASHEAQVAAAQTYLLKHTRLSVVSRGPKGCTARSASGETAAAPADDVRVVDTIGAGDFFTAGFLTAYLQGAPLQRCAEAGCATGAAAVQVSGAEMSSETWARLGAEISVLVAPSRQAVWSRWIDPRGWAGMSGAEVTAPWAALPLCILGVGMLASHLSRKA